MNNIFLPIFCCLIVVSQGVILEQNYPLGSSVAKYGKLQVNNLQLVSQSGEAVQLRGMSTHGPQWFENCYSLESFTALAQEWKVDVIRIAMYVTEGGYNDKPQYWKDKVTQYVQWAGQVGVYALIDWHTLTPGDPNDGNYQQNKDFFTSMSQTFANSNHVLYEICNEPNGVSWSQVANYANDLIPLIRRNDPNTVIIVGTPFWSSDLGSVQPLSYPNIMYTFHFYAASSTTWDFIAYWAGRLPIFVTEFGTCEYTGQKSIQFQGNGNVNIQNADQWVYVLNGNNSGNQKISFINWTFSDANESCASLNSNSCGSQQWNQVTYSGAWVKARTTESH